MQLEFDKQKQEIHIKDDVPNHSWLIITLMLVNLFNMAFQLSAISFNKNQFIYSLLVVLTIVSLGVLFFYIFKRSWKSKYKLTKIAGIETKIVFGKQRVFLKLLNGKKRSFPILKNETELQNLKKTLISMGIKSI